MNHKSGQVKNKYFNFFIAKFINSTYENIYASLCTSIVLRSKVENIIVKRISSALFKKISES